LTFRNKYNILNCNLGVLYLIFEQEYIVFELFDVLYAEQSYAKRITTDRNFEALSFRFKSNTVIETDKQQIELCDNSICYFPSNVPYTRISKEDKLVVIHFKTFNYHTNSIECIFPDEPEKYRELFTKLLDTWNNKDVSYKHESAALLNRIFSELYKDNAAICSENKISEGVLYIKKNFFQQDFSLSDAASKSFMSEQYFRRLFKKEFGMSPKKYVIENRIKRAQALILTNHYTISEISELCGYSDYNHFSTEFKKITGISPSKYCYNYTI